MARTLPPKRRSSMVPRYLRVVTTTGSPPPMRSTLPRPRSMPSRPTSTIRPPASGFAVIQPSTGIDSASSIFRRVPGSARTVMAEAWRSSTRMACPLRSASSVPL